MPSVEQKISIYYHYELNQLERRMITREQAKALCYKYHGNQSRRGVEGEYVDHPIAVARMVEEYGGSELAITASYLHDLLEDTECTIDILKSYGADDDLLTVMDIVTRRANEGSREHYERVLASDNLDALYVKTYDNYHNSIWSRKQLKWQRETFDVDPYVEIAKYASRYIKLMMKVRRMKGVYE